MSQPVRARRLSEDEGRCLLRLVRRGKHESIRVRRALIVMASASGTTVPAIARLVAADEDTVRDVIHAFNAEGLACLGPRWAGGRPRRITDADTAVIVKTATTRPRKHGLPFTHWSIRKLAAYLAGRYGRTDPRWAPARRVRIGRERLRQILHARGITFQRTRTWKESHDPDLETKLDRIEEVADRSRIDVSPSTSSGRCRSGPVTAPAGPPAATLTGCARPTSALTASGTSTAATAWPRTGCGVSCTNTKAASTPWPRSHQSARPARTALRSTSSWTTSRPTPHQRSEPGVHATRSSCV
jgi:transposase